jgi:hypothetical protein
MSDDRRFRSGDAELDLDMTWQNALRQAHSRMDQLFAEISKNATRVALVEHELKDIGAAIIRIEESLHKLSSLRDQITGGARLVMLMGTFAVFLASTWDSIVGFLKGLLKS